MSKANQYLSKRETQILDILFRLGKATVAEVRDALPDPPTYSSVRASLRILENKGHAVHRQDGPRYVYLPAEKTSSARQSALKHLLHTFFGGSVHEAIASLIHSSSSKLSAKELDRIRQIIDQAKKRSSGE